MKTEENDIARGLKKKRDNLCKKLGLDPEQLDFQILNKTEHDIQTAEIADLCREILKTIANSDVPDEMVVLWLNDFLRDLKTHKITDPLGSMRINAMLAEQENFGV
jgi:hypothetical protein